MDEGDFKAMGWLGAGMRFPTLLLGFGMAMVVRTANPGNGGWQSVKTE